MMERLISRSPSGDPRHRTRTIVGAGLAAVAALWVFVAPGYWVFTATTGILLAVATVGLTAVVGWTREVSLVQAGLTGTALYVCAFATREGRWEWPYLAAACLAIALVVGISVLVSLSTARLSGIYIAILTLALQLTLERTVFANKKLALDSDPTRQVPRPSLLGIHLTSDRAYYLFTLAVLGLLVLFLARLRVSRFGRGLLLVGTDRQAASAVGVSPWRAKIIAFALAGFCAGVAGVLTAGLYPLPPYPVNYQALNSFSYLAIPVLAGFESFLAVVTVAVVFAVSPQLLEQYHISPLYLGSFGLLLGMLAGPAGLGGLVLSKARAAKRGRDRVDGGIDIRETMALPDAVPTTHQGEESSAWALRVLEEYLAQRVDDGDVLTAKDVCVAFGGLAALRDVSLAVPARNLVGLIGPNGAGKSTLFDVLNGLRSPDSGQVVLFGEDVSRATAWDRAARGLSRTFQASRVNLDLTVSDNLLAGAYLKTSGNAIETLAGLPRARAGEREAAEAARAVAQLLSLTATWDEPVRSLDFGTQRRVEIGRSLMSGPRLLLLDEPCAGLDATEAAALFALVRRLEQDLGLTVLLVEHYVKAVLENCDLIYVLSQGQIIAAGTPDEIAADPQVRAVYLGDAHQPRDEVRSDA